MSEVTERGERLPVFSGWARDLIKRLFAEPGSRSTEETRAIIEKELYAFASNTVEHITPAEIFALDIGWISKQEIVERIPDIDGFRLMACSFCAEPVMFIAKYVDEDKQCLKWYGCRPVGSDRFAPLLAQCPKCGIEFGYPPPIKEREIKDDRKAKPGPQPDTPATADHNQQ